MLNRVESYLYRYAIRSEYPVVLLCVQGMDAEGEADYDKAHQLFKQAWDMANNDFEASTAAHYLARNQKDPNDKLKWNLEALNLAHRVEHDGVQGYYPSLYLNVAKSYEDLGDRINAIHYYEQAAESCEHLPDTGYADMIRSGVDSGLKRVALNS